MTEHEQPKNVIEMRPVSADEMGMRLDRWFKHHYPSVTHGALQKMLRGGNIRVDGKKCKADSRLESGQIVRVPPLPKSDGTEDKRAGSMIHRLSKTDRQELSDMILLEDEDILVLNKPSGLAVQGGTKSNHRNLDRLIRSLVEDRKAGTGDDVRLTHRLDKETSGLLVFAKNRLAAQKITEYFRHKKTDKTYLALTYRVPMPHQGEITLPLLKTGERVIVDYKDGQRAQTSYRVLDHAAQKAALVELKPETGRTHQLRVHMESLGTPILGDSRYSSFHAEEWMQQQNGLSPEQRNKLYLHAWRLAFPHPRTGKNLALYAPIPAHFADLCDILGFAPPRQ